MTFPEPVDSGAKCCEGHPLWLVAEGYAYCIDHSGLFHPWRLARPTLNRSSWSKESIVARDGSRIGAWVSAWQWPKERCIAFIAEDIEAHRAHYVSLADGAMPSGRRV